MTSKEALQGVTAENFGRVPEAASAPTYGGLSGPEGGVRRHAADVTTFNHAVDELVCGRTPSALTLRRLLELAWITPRAEARGGYAVTELGLGLLR